MGNGLFGYLLFEECVNLFAEVPSFSQINALFVCQRTEALGFEVRLDSCFGICVLNLLLELFFSEFSGCQGNKIHGLLSRLRVISSHFLQLLKTNLIAHRHQEQCFLVIVEVSYKLIFGCNRPLRVAIISNVLVLLSTRVQTQLFSDLRVVLCR